MFFMMFSGKIDGFFIVDPSGVNSSHVDFALDIVLLVKEDDGVRRRRRRRGRRKIRKRR